MNIEFLPVAVSIFLALNGTCWAAQVRRHGPEIT